jgi:outer membrane lipoprotein SlyB
MAILNDSSALEAMLTKLIGEAMAKKGNGKAKEPKKFGVSLYTRKSDGEVIMVVQTGRKAVFLAKADWIALRSNASAIDQFVNANPTLS